MSIAQPDLTGLWESRLQKMELGKVLFCAYFCDVYFLCDKTQLNRMLLITCLNGWFFLSTDRKTRTHSWLTFANSQGTCRIHRSARSYFLLLLRLSCIYISIFLKRLFGFVCLFICNETFIIDGEIHLFAFLLQRARGGSDQSQRHHRGASAWGHCHRAVPGTKKKLHTIISNKPTLKGVQWVDSFSFKETQHGYW